MNGPVCKIERMKEEWLGPSISDFKEEVSTPFRACTAADQQRGGCSHTHCHTYEGKKKKN